MAYERPGLALDDAGAAEPQSQYNVPRLDIACVIASLRTGGAERVLADLANTLERHGHRVAILTLMDADEAPFYPLSTGVGLVRLGGLGPASSLGSPADILRAAWRLRAALKRQAPRLVLGFTTLGSMLAMLASRGLGVPVVAAERIDPAGHGRRIGRLRTSVRDALYARADHVVVQTARARRALTWLPDARISCIANPVPLAQMYAAPEVPAVNGRYRLLGLGRLDRQKGFDLLVAAFARLADRFPDWDLVIHGDGPERAALEAAAGSLLGSGRIVLPGVTRDAAGALAAVHVLAFPSRYEGFPNALAEAMAAGLPAVGFNDVSGVEDLIVTAPASAATGLLADAEAPLDGLTKHLATLMADAPLRRHLGDNARRRVAAFTPQIHYEQWERLLSRLTLTHAR